MPFSKASNRLFYSLGRWSVGSGGVKYTFRNGHSVTGHGSLSNGGSVGVRYTIPIGRKRRSVEDAPKLHVTEKEGTKDPLFDPSRQLPLYDDGDQATRTELDQPQQLPVIPASKSTDDTAEKSQEQSDKCNECLDVQPFDFNDKSAENKTLASNQFVMVVKLIEENLSAMKMNAKIRFEVVEVVKSPVESVQPGETFTISAELAKCPCLTSFDPGHYIVTGSMNEKNQLVLSNTLMEFE